MSQFVEFLLDTPDGAHKKGEQIVVTDDNERNALITHKFVKSVPGPKAATDAATDCPSLQQFVEKTIKDEFGSLTAKLVGTSKGAIGRIHDNAEDDPRWGYTHIGDQVSEIIKWSRNPMQAEHSERFKRIGNIVYKAPSTYAQEAFGADGGFLLAPEFANELLRWTFPDEGIFNRCRSFTTSSNNLTVPKDETVPWGTTGVQTYWTSEAAQLTQTKPALGQMNLILEKITCLVPVTDEMQADAFLGLGQYITSLAAPRIRFKAEEAIVNGTGSGQPLGFVNSGAVVSQAKVSGQATQTIVLQNVAQMIPRIPLDYMRGLVWLIHPSAFHQLVIMTNGNQSLYVAPGQLEEKGGIMGRLMGIPIIMSQHCQTIGTVGDIMLVDLSQYLLLTKGTGIESAMSIHLFFDYHINTFRFIFRMAGQPWMRAPITSFYGSYQQSPFVTLAAR